MKKEFNRINCPGKYVFDPPHKQEQNNVLDTSLKLCEVSVFISF